MTILETDCPCCSRGKLMNNQCTHCHVVIARGAMPEERLAPRTQWKRRQDQDRVGGYTDIARYQEDHRG